MECGDRVLKVAVITGGSRGIGSGCVEIFCAAGYRVVTCGLHEESDVSSWLTDLNSRGPGHVDYISCDIRDESKAKEVVNFAVEKYGRIDCLLNNAGIHPDHTSIDNFTSEQFLDIFRVNVLSFFNFSKFCLPYLRQSKGSIVNMSSLVAQMGDEGAVIYVCSKGAVEAMTKALAIDEAKHGVRVNGIAPSNIWTSMWQKEASAMPDPKQYIQDGADAQLMGRFGTTDEVGKACLFLCEEATFCTGTTLNVTGGSEMGYGMKTRVAKGQ